MPQNDPLDPIQTREIRLPEGATLQEGVVSPQQQFIVWNLQNSQTSPLLAWLHRFLPKFAPKPTVTEGLWISRIDGRGLQEIGHMPAALDANREPEDPFSDIRWLPDGKQVSFVYHDTLYVVPAVLPDTLP